jgi:hypothetical protein
MPLQNRVDPFGGLIATAARGMLFGNRGGKFHRDDRTLPSRRHATRQWICCVLSFKGRRRNVWGRYYTELFFLDEPTALAAGHRPCFECRRAEANDFALKFAGRDERAAAPEMDDVLHAERLNGRAKRLHRRRLDDLPDGAFITLSGDDAFAVKGRRLLRWTAAGYTETRLRKNGIDVQMLTPPSIARVLSRGYAPRWHPSAS